ncbi:MAG: hypothetical protein KGJ34_02970 [Patescibacteria group bacterium]|nr:hypothetical protein [Patescibacteria group bacterium]
MPRAPIAQSRLKLRRRRRYITLATIILVLIALLFGGLVALARAHFWRIATIVISGDSSVPTSTVEAFAQGELSGDYLFLFPKNNILLYPRQKLQENIAQSYPELASVSVSTNSLSQISITLTSRQPAALWCGEVPLPALPQGPTSCLILDASGVAYAQTNSPDTSSYIAYYGALSTSSTQLPVQFLTPSGFESLSALIAALAQKANAGSVVSVAVDEDNDVSVQFSDGFLLLFALRQDTGKVLQYFSLALTSAPFQNNSLSSIQYLDLRFGDKLYYKLR